ncbi:hypothetical protein AAGS40_23355 [Paraburkholderia sp. PREW-6R]|uniref:hypothetical protein n=1 Tax=Paraburkholderia sp. PREW-6R TaxID=3141544 RepID=UPI0031F50F6A
MRQAFKLGLKREVPSPRQLCRAERDESLRHFASFLTDIPTTADEIAARSSMEKSEVDALLMRLSKARKCHIADWVCSGGREFAVWVAGAGRNAVNSYAKERQHCDETMAKGRPVAPFRDPLVSAFFGPAA